MGSTASAETVPGRVASQRPIGASIGAAVQGPRLGPRVVGGTLRVFRERENPGTEVDRREGPVRAAVKRSGDVTAVSVIAE